MKQFLIVVLAVLFGVVLWRIGERLSADAIGLAVGVIFGVLAGLPAAVLVLANSRLREERRHERRPVQAQNGYAGQPPVIVLTGGQSAPQALHEPQNTTPVGWRTHQAQERQFRWVGVPEGADNDRT